MEYETLRKQLEEEARRYAHRNQHQMTRFVGDGREMESWLSCCTKCGMRAIVRPEHDIRLEGAATVQPCDENALRLIEAKAWIIGEVSDLLWRRLNEELASSALQTQNRFCPGEFQTEYYRFVSDDGMLGLQWKLREIPEQPIHGDNPQSKTGIVELVTLVPRDALQPAHYIGDGNDPNDPDNADGWEVEPLITGEAGFAYLDDLGYWRFKREDGNFGFYIEESEIQFVTESTPAQATVPPTEGKEVTTPEQPNKQRGAS